MGSFSLFKCLWIPNPYTEKGRMVAYKKCWCIFSDINQVAAFMQVKTRHAIYGLKHPAVLILIVFPNLDLDYQIHRNQLLVVWISLKWCLPNMWNTFCSFTWTNYKKNWKIYEFFFFFKEKFVKCNSWFCKKEMVLIYDTKMDGKMLLRIFTLCSKMLGGVLAAWLTIPHPHCLTSPDCFSHRLCLRHPSLLLLLLPPIEVQCRRAPWHKYASPNMGLSAHHCFSQGASQ